jgi:hypothetical protein
MIPVQVCLPPAGTAAADDAQNCGAALGSLLVLEEAFHALAVHKPRVDKVNSAVERDPICMQVIIN